MNNCDV